MIILYIIYLYIRIIINENIYIFLQFIHDAKFIEFILSTQIKLLIILYIIIYY